MSSFSLHIDFFKVVDLESKHPARTWFFLIQKSVEEVAERLKDLVQEPEYRVKYLCFAEEKTLEGEVVTIGYLEFIYNRGLSGIKSYPGLDMSIIGQRNIKVIKPEQAVSFIKGNYQMGVGEYKPLNEKFWASAEVRARQRGRKCLGKKAGEVKEGPDAPVLFTTAQSHEWLKKLLSLQPISIKNEREDRGVNGELR